MSDASGSEDNNDNYDDGQWRTWELREEEEEDSDDYDEDLPEIEPELDSDDEVEETPPPLPRDLAGVPCCSRTVDDAWMQPRKGEVHRAVVIDGANIVHTGSAYSAEMKDPMLDISSLLAWIRFFLVNDFEVITVLPQRYLRPTFVLHTDILKSLNQCGLLFVPNSLQISDDYIVLDLAKQCDGVVLSVDQYRDHCRAHPEVERTARLARVSPLFGDSKETQLEDDEWFHLTQDGRHWLAYHTLQFAERPSMEEKEWRGKFFSSPGPFTHELAVEQRERWSEEKKRRRLELVDAAIQQRMQRPPAYKEVISRREQARKLKEAAELEECERKMMKEFDRLRAEAKAKERAERRKMSDMNTVD